MGLSIGQIPAAVAGLRASPDFGRVRLREDVSFSRATTPQQTEDTKTRASDDSSRTPDVPRAGFGTGTVSPPGAALRTIRRTVEETRKAVPSLDDIRARFQANAEEARRASRESGNTDSAARTTEDITLRPVERRIPEAAAQARKFISGISNAVSHATDRVNGDTPQRDDGPTIQIRGEQVSFGGESESRTRPRLDLRA
jgi:hypothetical protein